MELAACMSAMEWIKQSCPAVTRVQIFSDSKYVVDCVPRAPYWQQNKWRNADKRPIENSDLWKQFLKLRGQVSQMGVRVDFGRVQGKSSPLLRKVDKAAKEAARSATALDRGYRIGKIGRPKSKEGASTMFPAAGQVLTICVYGSKLVGKTRENKIKFEVFDEITGHYGAKYFAYAQPEVGCELHRQRTFRVEMNDNPKYPRFVRVMEEILLAKLRK